MVRQGQQKRMLGLSVLAVVAALSAGLAPAPSGVAAYEAHTEPSKRSKLNFAAPGIVTEVLVKEGDTVKQGQALLKLDERADKHLLESLAMEGKSTLKIEAAEADLSQKKVELDRKLKSFEAGGVTQTEVDEAKINLLIREIQVKVESMTRRQKELEADRQAVRVEQMTVAAPFDGIVERIDLKVGETPDQQRPALYIVKNDMLHVTVPLPTGVALRLKMGDVLDVKYRDIEETVKGKVTFLSPFADAASETLLVRLELANPKGLPAGLGVSVLVPNTAPTVGAAK